MDAAGKTITASVHIYCDDYEVHQFGIDDLVITLEAWSGTTRVAATAVRNWRVYDAKTIQLTAPAEARNITSLRLTLTMPAMAAPSWPGSFWIDNVGIY